MSDYTKLNALYRAEGWGLVTDKALGIEPCNVESQARNVARWANTHIAELKAALTAANDELAELRKTPKFTCVICKKDFEGFGNNPEPVKDFDSGRCCDYCNDTVVIPARISNIRKKGRL